MAKESLKKVNDGALGDILLLNLGVDRKEVVLHALQSQCLTKEQTLALECIIAKYEALTEGVPNSKDSNVTSDLALLRSGMPRLDVMLLALDEMGVAKREQTLLNRIIDYNIEFKFGENERRVPSCETIICKRRCGPDQPTMRENLDDVERLVSEFATNTHTAFLRCAKALLEYTSGLRDSGEVVLLCKSHSTGPQSKAQFERLVWNEIGKMFGEEVPKFFSSHSELAMEQRRSARTHGRSGNSVELTQDLREGFLFNTLAGFLGAACCFHKPQVVIDQLYKAGTMRRYRVPHDPADLLSSCTDALEQCVNKQKRLLNDLGDTDMVIDNPDYLPNERRGSTDAGGGQRNIRKSDGL